MASYKAHAFPAMRRQHLLAEFSGLKQACPEGVFMSLTPGDPSLWSGVLFVRKGPYATAIIRFQISFPDSYPQLPPLVTFSTDIFHPLITPLTTYTYTTDIQDGGTVSASDEERLPPGGFSLRHGFPGWFGRASRRAQRSRQTSGEVPDTTSCAVTSPQTVGGGGGSNSSSSSSKGSPISRRKYGQLQNIANVSIFEILRYIRSTFDDARVLDAVPLEAAGNPGAWHAWRSHQQSTKGPAPFAPSAAKPTSVSPPPTATAAPTTPVRNTAASPSTPVYVDRKPGEWNWEGVWENRVKKGITTSLSEAVLYGGVGTPDEVIQFIPLDEGDLMSARKALCLE